ncbi:hypothetical protein VTN31DRAFT_2973 [Thermomyces dupontii]|uniref:mitochondrial 37S ribosomal protein mS42 n=1 Tax=Talaromyces thermophilus TaxID=28565 RepID=UPI0037442D25
MLHRFFRPQSGLRAVSSIVNKPSSVFNRCQTRYLHRVPQLTHDAYFKEHGVPDLLSPEGFDFAWTQYQGLMVEKLNLLTQDTVDADAKPGELLLKYAKRRDMAALFNYASMAHNNHFFFNLLSPTSVPMPEDLVKDIDDSCSSVESLKQDFLAAASAMFGPGFVWLVTDMNKEGMIKILCTYNAGSPYPQAYTRRQSVDMNTENPESPASSSTGTQIGNQFAGVMGSHAPNRRDLAPGAIDVQPILCVNTWEHVWMMDYGIAGKDEFLERWWNRVNWEAVFENHKTAIASKGGRNPVTRQRTLGGFL